MKKEKPTTTEHKGYTGTHKTGIFILLTARILVEPHLLKLNISETAITHAVQPNVVLSR